MILFTQIYFFKNNKKEYIVAESEVAVKVYQYMLMPHISLFVKSHNGSIL